MSKVAIIDYGVSNITSVERAFRTAGFDVQRILEPYNDLRSQNFNFLVLPGIGKFSQGMRSLEKLGWPEALGEWISDKGKLVGICLGMQLLCSFSEESMQSGLGLLNMKVQKLQTLGWNQTSLNAGWKNCQSGLDESVLKAGEFFFQHKFALDTVQVSSHSEVLEYLHVENSRVVAGLRTQNIVALQFHPEKSHQRGIQIISNLKKWN